MGVNSLPKTVTRQHRDCDLNPGLSTPESSTLTTRLPSHLMRGRGQISPLDIGFRGHPYNTRANACDFPAPINFPDVSPIRVDFLGAVGVAAPIEMR